MKIFISILIVTASLSALSVSAAELTTTSMAIDTSNRTCINIQKSPLRFKKSDDILLVQKFLMEKGLLLVEPTGYFGMATSKAIKAYQSQKAIPSTGALGPLTRAAIKNETCIRKDSNVEIKLPVSLAPEKQSTTTTSVITSIISTTTIGVVSTSTPASPLNPINGACGSSSGVYAKVAPVINLCKIGTASSVSGVGPFYWTCGGIEGGLFASCGAPLATASSPIDS